MRIHARSKSRRGATMVETTVVIAIALLFMFGIFEYARYVMTRQILENAARDGARYAAVHTYDGTTADIQNEVDQKLSIGSKQLVGYNKTSSIQVFAADSSGNAISGKTWYDANFGEGIGVQISGTYHPILPNFLFMNASFSISAKSVMASEAN